MRLYASGEKRSQAGPSEDDNKHSIRMRPISANQKIPLQTQNNFRLSCTIANRRDNRLSSLPHQE